MNKPTLTFLLRYAGCEIPIQGQFFRENPNICFEELLAEGYLEPANHPSELAIRIDGVPYHVYEDEVNGRARYWYVDGDETFDIEGKWVNFYSLNYTPLARLLTKFFRAEDPDDTEAPNHAWDLGMPEDYLNQVHLVRNGGTDDRVKQVMADYASDAVVFCIGREPDRKSTPATWHRLASYLACVDGKLYFKSKILECLRESDTASLSACPNRIMKRGKCTYEFYFEGKGPASISYILGAEYLPRIINAGSAGIPIFEVVSGKKIPDVHIKYLSQKNKLSWEDKESHGMNPERSIPRLSKKYRKLYEIELENIKKELDDLESNSTDKRQIQLQRKKYESVKKILNASKNFDDGVSRLRHHVRVACMDTLCAQLKKQGLDALAEHLAIPKTIVIGAWCRYQPTKMPEWDIHI